MHIGPQYFSRAEGNLYKYTILKDIYHFIINLLN